MVTVPNKQAVKLDEGIPISNEPPCNVKGEIPPIVTDQRAVRICTQEEIEEVVNDLAYEPRRIGASGWPGDVNLKDVDVPGLYSWWADQRGAEDLSEGIGLTVKPGIVYVGQAGATRWPSGQRSLATLNSRIFGMHLGKNASIDFSTLRLTLAASLAKRLQLVVIEPRKLHSDSEGKLTEWMRCHLEIAVHVFGERDALKELESKVNKTLDPPLNIKGMPPSPIRRRLKELRQTIRRG